MVLIDFDQRPGPVGGLHDAIAFGPRFHIALPARLAATTAAAPIAAEAAAATAEPAFGLRTRLVHGQTASPHLKLIELGGGLLRFLVGRHLDKREPAGAARRGVSHDAHGLDR